MARYRDFRSTPPALFFAVAAACAASAAALHFLGLRLKGPALSLVAAFDGALALLVAVVGVVRLMAGPPPGGGDADGRPGDVPKLPW